jgi:epoxyqueuosine reductase QueG
MADALLLIPPAIASGLGELGKHGSIISRHFGAGLRLAAVTTDMPLMATFPDRFGADDFCKVCQICTRECPPGAIAEQKQMVRGVERWYVDFDKCIPYFAESASCGICIAVCPWTKPPVRPKLLAAMARRLGQTPEP